MEISTVKRIDRALVEFEGDILLKYLSLLTRYHRYARKMEYRNVHLIEKGEINYLRSKGEYRKASDRVKDRSSYKL